MAVSKWSEFFTKTFSNWSISKTRSSILSQEAYDKFIEAYPMIMNKTLQSIRFLKQPERLNKIIEYNVRKENQLEAQMFMLGHDTLQKSGKTNHDLKFKQHVMAWCIEMLFVCAAITDDFEENSKTRYNKTCWHLLPEVGRLIINDANTVQYFVYEMLRQNFEDSQYIDIIKLLNENDFEDFFDDDARTGKTGSDIEEGKCTWLAVTTLQLCNEAQRKEFETCYGNRNPSYVDRIRALYNELNITDIYYREKKSYYIKGCYLKDNFPVCFDDIEGGARRAIVAIFKEGLSG
ncbi:uncharacterized protein [Battus philenor]|uniref:uncharacterized protein n=1 Tax=Battus philenor TaxID=42288 RepID=UPI0035D004AE